ncbi:MAG: hypothetical protein AUG49_24340 [Catenulispora sp. 13_1_20CM_3_70_7]|jgi:hypothetical protein|nr:hypothetical protein [Catenulisporales bacterium]OLE20685.1 MAG: hypothetical protein AUG49_24340 [Catenulispora sp. 13_1_20CM_3_70_7]
MRVRLGGTRHARDRPAPALKPPAAYDVLDVPASAGHRVLLQLERLGTPLGPVLSVRPSGPGHEPGSRLRFFVEAGTTASFLADLKELGWEPADTDVRTIGVVPASETPLPPPESPRWMRPPETGRPVVLPPARLLLGALAYACRRGEGRSGYRPLAGFRAE